MKEDLDVIPRSLDVVCQVLDFGGQFSGEKLRFSVVKRLGRFGNCAVHDEVGGSFLEDGRIGQHGGWFPRVQL